MNNKALRKVGIIAVYRFFGSGKPLSFLALNCLFRCENPLGFIEIIFFN